MPQGKPSHAEMIATVRQIVLDADDDPTPPTLTHDEVAILSHVLAHLERTQWRRRSEIADTTLGLDTEVLGFQPNIGNEAEDEIPSRYGVTTAGHLATGGWEKCTHYQLLSPPEREC